MTSGHDPSVPGRRPGDVQESAPLRPLPIPAGDAACWLAQLCAQCGAVIEGPPGTSCWRCGGTRREGDD